MTPSIKELIEAFRAKVKELHIKRWDTNSWSIETAAEVFIPIVFSAAEERAYQRVLGAFEQTAKDLENAMTTVPQESEWNSALKQSAAKIRSLITQLSNEKDV